MGTVLWVNKQPTTKELQQIEAARLAEQQKAAADAVAESDMRLFRKMLRLMHRRLRNEITAAQYIAQSDVIIANHIE